MFGKLWKDPVVSSVIGGLMLLGLSSVTFWTTTKEWLSAAWHWLTGAVWIPVWLLLLLSLGSFAVVLMIVIRWRLQRRLVRPFKDLTPQQQDFLRARYASGTRRFELPTLIPQQRWFEQLTAWNYVEYIPIRVRLDGLHSHVLTDAAWQELEKQAS